MPFTISHAVVALPFRRARWFVPSAIAAGAMAPDVPLFAPILAPYAETHELWAAPTIDVVLAYLLLAGWSALIRLAIHALAPRRVRPRLPAQWRRPAIPRPTLALLVSLAFGALTHVTWDAFTHRGRLGSQLIPALATKIGPFALTSLLQYASSVGGMLVLIWWGSKRLRQPAPPNGSRPSTTAVPGEQFAPRVRYALVIALVVTPSAFVVVTLLAALQAGTDVAIADLAFDAITGAVDTVVVILAAVGCALAIRGFSVG